MVSRPRVLRLLAGVLIAALAGCRSRTSHEGSPLDQRVFVWQRVWTDEVIAAVRELSRGSLGPIQGMDILVADIDLRRGAPPSNPIAPDWPSIASTSLPVGLVIRVAPEPSLLPADGAAIDELVHFARAAFADAAAAGVVTRELMIDHDVGTRRLADYAASLARLRKRLPDTHLTITALPDWLTSPAFASVASSVDGYVLQVHALGPPRNADDRRAVYDATRAAAAVERASRLGKAFRIALPCYGYEVGFDPAGNVLGAVAEGATVAWPGETAVRMITADPAEVAASVRTWAQDRPKPLQGFTWFRLPVRGDRLTWRAATLRAVAQGQAPRPALAVETRAPEPGLVEVDLTNGGDADGRDAVTIRLRLQPSDAVVLARDAVGGFRWDDQGGGYMTLAADELSLGTLRASERRTIAWIRADRALNLEVEGVDVRR